MENIQKNKKIILKYICFIILLFLIIVGVLNRIKKSYAIDSKIYTRKEMQEMLVSTALSLYYNNYFSDYGQRAMDSLSYEGEDGNYFNSGNFLWRDLNISPEEVGYSKYYHIDCSGYNFLIYMNTIGYDMSEYNIVNRYRLFNKDNVNYPQTRVSFYSGTTRLDKFREAYEKFGYGWNSGFLGNVGRKIINNCGDTNCTILDDIESTTPVIYNNLENKDKNELAYYFEARKYVSLETVKKYYAIAEEKLQPGDIISYTMYDASEDSTSGHVMFYAGDDIMTSTEEETGFTDLLLHSIGNGGGDYTDSQTSVNNKLRKKTSIVASSAKYYVDGNDGRFESVYGNTGDYVVRFAIYRPLNTVCTDDNTCKIKSNEFNVELTETQLNNNEARVALKKNQVQQYMILEKKYNSNITPTTDVQDGYTRNIISEYNSINVGDSVIFRLRLRNKFDNIETRGIKLEAEIPANTTYVSDSCTDDCKIEGNKLIWENIIVSGENVNNDISFKIKANEEGIINFKGYKVITSATKNISSKELQMSDLNITVEPTQNGINKEILINTVEKFKELVNNGQINYIANGKHSENIKDINELINDSSKTISLSAFGFIKFLYYNAFGLDLDALTGTENILSSTKIKNAIFEVVPYPERNNFKIKGEDGLYPLYTGDTSITVFGKKTAADYGELNSLEKIISEMLVPGLYGGRHLKGNDNNDRIKFLRSFYNNSAYQSDLEVGDIIISFTNNAESMRVFLYLGDDEYGPILTGFTISNSEEPLFLYHTDKYLDQYYQDETLRKKTTNKPSNQILNELFNKDLFVVLRPSKLGTTVEYEYNGGIKGTNSYVAYNKYKNLVTPTKDDYTLILDVNNEKSNEANLEYIGKNEFKCWSTDIALNNCISNDSDLITDRYHKLYAKYILKEVLLPQLELDGYIHTGWYSDKELTNKVASVNSKYVINENITLYAKWETDINITSDVFDIDLNNKIISDINLNTTFDELVNQIVTNDFNITFLDNNKNELNGNEKIKTGYIVRFGDDVEYRLSVLGDVNGDGIKNINDVIKVAKYLTNNNELEKLEYINAADVNSDKKVNINDVIKLAKSLIVEN